MYIYYSNLSMNMNKNYKIQVKLEFCLFKSIFLELILKQEMKRVKKIEMNKIREWTEKRLFCSYSCFLRDWNWGVKKFM